MSEKVCIVGSGNWGTCIARIIGANVLKLSSADVSRWTTTVNMWVYEETLSDGRKLSEVINTEHENVKYLPGFKIPENVVAVPNLVDAAQGATLLIFVVPHQFVDGICRQLIGVVSPQARGISLIKGLDCTHTDASESSTDINLISTVISNTLSIDVSVLMGANLANDIAAERFSEATIGYNANQLETAKEWKQLFETPSFRIALIDDVCGVEICGALKNIVAVAAGFVDGLFGEGQANNSKAAVMRIGLDEIRRFCRIFDAVTIKDATFWASCGVADLITTCNGGRNRKVAEAFVRERVSLDELEHRLLQGQKLQGPATALKVYHWLAARGRLDEFPLISTVYRICYEGQAVENFFTDITVRYDELHNNFG